LAKIGPVDFELIGLTEIFKNEYAYKDETEAELGDSPPCLLLPGGLNEYQ